MANVEHTVECPDCGGDGRDHELQEPERLTNPCPHCWGEGLFVRAHVHRGAVEAERKRVAEYVRVRGRGADCWDPSVEATLGQVAHEIERDHHHGGR